MLSTQAIKRPLVLLLLLITLTACNKAIQRGDDLAEQGQWYGAYQSYATALAEDPEDEELQATTEATRQKAIDQAITQGDQAVDQKKWDEASTALGQVIALTKERPETRAKAFVKDFRLAQRQDLQTLLSEDASSIVHAFEILSFSSVHLQEANDEDRRMVLTVGQDAATAQEQQGRFDKAEALFVQWRAVADPVSEEELGRLLEESTLRWLEALRTTREDAKKEGNLPKALIFAQAAHNVTDNPSSGDAAQLRALQDQLGHTHSVGLRITPTRLIPNELFLKPAGVRAVLPKDPESLAVIAVLQPSECRQTQSERSESKRYVSGTRRVPNPRRDDLAQTVGDYQVKERRINVQVEQAREDVDSLRQATSQYEYEQMPFAQKQVRVAQRRLRRAEEIEEQVRRRYNRVANQRVSGQQAQRNKNQTLQELSRQRQDASAETREAGNQLRDMENQVRRVQRDWQSTQNDLNRAVQDLRSLQNDLANVQGELARAVTLYNNEPLEVDEPVWSDYPYTVTQWQRRCEHTYTLRYNGGMLNKPVTHSRTVWVTTKDDAHRAHPTIQLAKDPLAYPKSLNSQRQELLRDMRLDLASQHQAIMENYVIAKVDRAKAQGAAGDGVVLGLSPLYMGKLAGTRKDVFARWQQNQPLLMGINLP